MKTTIIKTTKLPKKEYKKLLVNNSITNHVIVAHASGSITELIQNT